MSCYWTTTGLAGLPDWNLSHCLHRRLEEMSRGWRELQFTEGLPFQSTAAGRTGWFAAYGQIEVVLAVVTSASLHISSSIFCWLLLPAGASDEKTTGCEPLRRPSDALRQ